MSKQRVIAYIDGFNIFYCSLKKTSNKWLDIYSLAKSQLKPHQELVGVKYFSAQIKSMGTDSRRPDRQQVYLDALSQNKNIDITLGYFSLHPTPMPLADDFIKGKISIVTVMKTEEKGTDVNLAVQLAIDAKDDKFDCAMLFSNDTDMAYSAKVATKECNKLVGLYIDKKSFPTKVLQENISYIKRLSGSVFANNQLPDKITTKDGRIITKPKDW